MSAPLPARASTGFHVAIKTADLEATRIFWRDIIGLKKFTPRFRLSRRLAGLPAARRSRHHPCLCGRPRPRPLGHGTIRDGAIDHISLSCSGYRAYIARFEAAGLDWREFIVPGTSLWQLFVYDPSGVQLELTFEASIEGAELPDVSEVRVYRAGRSFFDPDTYPKLARQAAAGA